MFKKILLSFALLGLGIASAKSYTVTLFQPASVGATVLQPGEYKVEVVDQKVTIRSKATQAESAVTVENGKEKFSRTTVRFDNANGKMRIQEIRLGGTSTKLVLPESGA